MHGKVSEFETLMRRAILHLLDIDGDVFHHSHNSVGKFLNPFGGLTDIRDYLKLICEILAVNFRKPPNYVQHRWLSILDDVDVNVELLPPLTDLYYAWVDNEDKALYKSDVEKLLETASSQSVELVSEIRKKCALKSLTTTGVERKKRIVNKIFHNRIVINLHAQAYVAVLPLIKSFIPVFEQKEPMIRRLFDELKSCMLSFLRCFMKTEKIVNLSGKKLMKINVKSKKRSKTGILYGSDGRFLLI